MSRDWPVLASLRVRLILLVLLATLPFFGLVIHSAIEERQAGSEAGKDNAVRLVLMAADHHRELIESTRQLLSTLALLKEVQNQDVAACSAILTNLRVLHPIYANLGAIRPDGQVFASAVPMESDTYLGDRTYFQMATNTGQFAIGDYQVGLITKRATLNMGYPAIDAAGRLRAVVYAALDLAWLNRLATNYNLPPGSSLTVLDRNYITLVRHPDPEGKLVGQRLQLTPRPPPPASAHPAPRARTSTFAGRDGVLRLYAYTRLAEPDQPGAGSVAIGIPVSVAFAAANQALRRNLIVLLVVTVAALGLTWVVGHHLVLRRVKALVRATEKLSVGDYAARTGVPYGKGELHLLARAFDEMADSLQRRIAERQRAEASLRALNEQLEQRVALRTAELQRSNEDLERFASVASHDLQEPLRMVTNYLALLKERYREKLDDHAMEFIGFAVDGAVRMQELIQGLLAYSRIDTRGQPFAPTDCNKVLERVLLNLKVALEESRATITHDPLPTVTADATQVAQLFQNLIANAIKFRGPHPPVVHVGVRLEGEHWHFSVRDNGIGIAPEHFERIFVMFQRLHPRAKYPGTGIGLSICKRIVERHGGRIWVESKLGQGTTFHFLLPTRPPGAGQL